VYDGGCGYGYCGPLEMPSWSYYGGICQYSCQYNATCAGENPPPPPGEPCQRNYPDVYLYPASQSATAGQQLNYTVSVTNNDSQNCTASTFSLNESCPTTPSEWACSLNSSSLNISPAQSQSTVLKVTSPFSASKSTSTVSVVATNNSSTTYSSAGYAFYEVANKVPTALIGCDNSQCGPGSSCSPDIAYNRNCQFSYLNQSTDPDNDITKTVWSIFYGSCPSATPWADPYLSCSGLCNLTLPSLPASQNYCLKLYIEDSTGGSDSATRSFYVRREAIADFDCSLDPEAEEAWQSCDDFIVNEGVVVYFLDKSSASEGAGAVTHREWTFKDGTPGQNIDNETNPFASFQKVDQNSGKVTIEIQDDVGREDATFHQVLPTIPLPEWKEIPPL